MRIITLLPAIALLALVPGCGGGEATHESVTRDMLDLMNEMVAVLRTVKDEASAEAAKPKLEALGEKQKALQDTMDRLGPPSADVQKQLEEKYAPELEKLAAEMGKLMMQLVSKPEVMQSISSELEKLK